MASRKARNTPKTICVVTTMILICISTGCATRKPTFVDMASFSKGIEPIYIMPVIDVRNNRSVEFTQQDETKIVSIAKKELERKGYKALVSKAWNRNSHVNALISDLNDSELAEVIPVDAGSAFVITISHLGDTYNGVVASFTVTASFLLVDASSGKAIWKDSESANHGAGGMLAAAASQIGERSSAYKASILSALKSLPEKR